MGILDKIEKGKQRVNLLLCIAGPGGVGKSSFAADAPSVLFLPTEDGSFNLDVARLPRPKTFSEAISMIDELIKTDHEYKTLAVDSIDWLESLCHQEVCGEKGVKGISEIPYGAGFAAAATKFQDFIQKIKTLRSKMNIILICHTQIKQFNDPVTGASFDRYTLKLHDKVTALVKEAVDVLLFANFETLVKRDGLKSKAFGDGKRVMFTQYRPAHDGKSRYALPYEMALSWKEFAEAIDRDEPASVDLIKEEIAAMLLMVKD